MFVWDGETQIIKCILNFKTHPAEVHKNSKSGYKRRESEEVSLGDGDSWLEEFVLPQHLDSLEDLPDHEEVGAAWK